MIRYTDALAIVRSVARVLPAETVRIERALGRVLAEDVVAAVNVPRFANSQMDGFALRASSAPGTLRVVRRVVAGDEVDGVTVGDGEAVEIMTGAPVPESADAVVKIEDVRVDGDRVTVPAVGRGAFVRSAGEDYRAGDVVAVAGTALTPEVLLALAHTGSGEVSVRRRPRVAVIPTGRELEVAGAPLLSAAALWASSSAYLEAALSACDVRVMPIVRDDPDAFVAALDACRDVDVVLSTGAVSAGVHDFIPAAIGSAKVHFHKMATRPAKPLLFAELDRRLFFGLPGNPISTAVAYRFVVWPAIAAMLGLPIEQPLRLPLVAPVGKPEGFRCFFKAVRDGRGVRVTEGQGSHLVRSLAAAQVWAVLPEDGARVEGEIDVYPLQPSV